MTTSKSASKMTRDIKRLRAADERKAAVADPRKIGIDLLEEAVLLDLTIHRWTNRRKTEALPKGRLNGKETNRLRTTMKMIESEQYDAIMTYLNEARSWVLARCMPSYIVRGIFLVKVDLVPVFEDKFREIKRWLAEEGIPALLADYPRALSQARDDFRDLAEQLNIRNPFDEREYPNPKELAARFGMDHAYISFGVPANLPAAIRAEEEVKIKAKFEAAADEITVALRAMFSELVTHATERLTVNPGEQKKIFKDSMFDQFTEFFETFNFRNFTNDSDLEDLVDKTRTLLQGVRPETLRDRPQARSAIAAQLQTIKTAVDQLITEAPSRAFDFGEDEEGV